MQSADIAELERHAAEEQQRLIRLPEVLRTVGMSRSAWYLLVSRGRAPRAVPLSERSRAWVEREIQEFVSARIAERDAKSAK
jgi:prophage regulatory protein